MKLALRVSIGAIALGSAASLTPRDARADGAGPQYQDVCDHAAAVHCLAKRRLPPGFRPQKLEHRRAAGPGGSTCAGGEAPPGGDGPPAGAMTPADVAAAYEIPPASSAGGKIVAIVDMPDSNALDELNTYRQAFGIPALPQCSGGLPDGTTPCFAAVDEDGNPGGNAGDCPAADAETGLDMAMVSAACPDCSLLLVQMTAALVQGPGSHDLLTAAQTAAKLGAVATSISFGGPEQGSDPTGYTTPGHLVLAASGDQGYLMEGGFGARTPSYPASAPDVLGVGGTLLQKGATAGGYSEVVWNDQTGATSSGCSTEFAMPAFQVQFGASHFGSCTKRPSADLAAAADFAPGGQGGGIASYDAHDGWASMVGTSAASPLVAAILTRVGLAERVASDMGFVYENLGAFHDVTSGSNDREGLCVPGDVMCTAGPGWDGPTGAGTPNATSLWTLGGGVDGGAPGGGSLDAGAPAYDSGGAGPGDDGGPASGSGSSSSSGGGSDAGSSSGSGYGGGDASSGSIGSPPIGGGPDASSGAGNADNPAPFGSQGGGGCACTLADGPAGSSAGPALAIAGALLLLASRRPRRRE